MGHPRRVSSLTFLLLLFAAVVVPLLAFGGLLLTRYAVSEQHRFERDALVTARQITAAVDRELVALRSVLLTLRTARRPTADDLAALREQAEELTRATGFGVVLYDEDGRERLWPNPVSTADGGVPGLEPASSAGDEPLVSNTFEDPRTGEVMVGIYAPVEIEGARNMLGVTIATRDLMQRIENNVPPGWFVGVGDRAGRYVLRSRDHDRWSGKPVLPEYVAKATDREGTFTSVNREGIVLLAGYAYSELSGWLVAANIPRDVVARPLRSSIELFALFGSIALALSGGLAFLVGRNLTRSMSELAAQALRVGRGEVIEPNRSFLRELELAGRALSRASRDLAERSAERETALQRQQLLMNELNHRVKNTLAGVHAMVSQTLRNASSVPEVQAAITARILALARAQDILTQESWEGADVSTLVAAALAPHLGERDRDRIRTEGPPVRVGPRAVLSLSLALHELSTNAVKYGALSNDTGRVALSWTVLPGPPRRFRMTWVESGGPTVHPPTRTGFGTRLIQRGLGADLLAEVTMDYRPTGLVFTVTTDFDTVADGSAVGDARQPVGGNAAA